MLLNRYFSVDDFLFRLWSWVHKVNIRSTQSNKVRQVDVTTEHGENPLERVIVPYESETTIKTLTEIELLCYVEGTLDRGLRELRHITPIVVVTDLKQPVHPQIK